VGSFTCGKLGPGATASDVNAGRVAFAWGWVGPGAAVLAGAALAALAAAGAASAPGNLPDQHAQRVWQTLKN
jgi:hypothetical protein